MPAIGGISQGRVQESDTLFHLLQETLWHDAFRSIEITIGHTGIAMSAILTNFVETYIRQDMDSAKKIIIAIDGFSSSGKSTMARTLAATIGYRYIDSGAMYRAVTLWAMRHGLIADDGTVDAEALTSALPTIDVDFAPADTPGGHQATMLNGENVEDEIRHLSVSNRVSQVAAIPSVRRRLTEMQQAMGAEKGIVMDGRDIGTTVFPDAEMKVYVDASAQTRAQRRFIELTDKGEAVTYEEVLANVVQRDHIDLTRAESPLRKADDAVSLDNSGMSLDEQNRWLLDLFRHVTDSTAR